MTGLGTGSVIPMRIWIQESLIRIRNTAQILSYLVKNCAACKCCSELGLKRKCSFSHFVRKLYNQLALPTIWMYMACRHWRLTACGSLWTPARTPPSAAWSLPGPAAPTPSATAPWRRTASTWRSSSRTGGSSARRAAAPGPGRAPRGTTSPRSSSAPRWMDRDEDHHRRMMCLRIISRVIFPICISCFRGEKWPRVDEMKPADQC